MSEVNQKDKTDHDKKEGADRGDVRAVSHIELVGDKEGKETKEKVKQEFGTPPPILSLEASHADKQAAHPFWIAARFVFVDRTPIRVADRTKWNIVRAKQNR